MWKWYETASTTVNFLSVGAMTPMSPESAAATNILASFTRKSPAFDSGEYSSRRFAGLII